MQELKGPEPGHAGLLVPHTEESMIRLLGFYRRRFGKMDMRINI
ncbi:hypothetical protein SDC9_207144 [bioreactor metagenome]|uniref:Uncharacterized protein n=1 Tax=bioreactor metagenome TaxID=1076179 RepID=A0A645JIH2_9ZZZZ